MTATNTQNFEILDRARRRYLAANPPRMNSVPAVDSSGRPAGEMTFPNLGDIQIIGAKLGMEFLAICHDEDAVEEWIQTAIGIVKDPEMAGILFANVFRGINLVIGSILDEAGLRTRMHQLAVEAWGRDFNDFSEPAADEEEQF